jgi:hypothetical protein
MKILESIIYNRIDIMLNMKLSDQYIVFGITNMEVKIYDIVSIILKNNIIEFIKNHENT